jgi:hypothetical protein
MAGAFDWNVAAAVASAISAVAAAVSALLSFSSLRTVSRIAREQRASQAVFQLVDLSLKHKSLSTSKKHEDYEWYVVAILELAREVLAAYPSDRRRRNQMELQLSFHAEQLADWIESCPNDIRDYGPEVERLVEEVVAKSQKIVAAE